jgi:hypothetical protein
LRELYLHGTFCGDVLVCGDVLAMLGLLLLLYHRSCQVVDVRQRSMKIQIVPFVYDVVVTEVVSTGIVVVNVT